MKFTATRTIDAAPADIRRTLQDVRLLASWNPAIGRLLTDDLVATVGKPYRTRLRGAVPATITFEEINDTSIKYRMDALGSRETGSWSWEETAPGKTTTTHAFEHDGFLINIMSHAFEQVPTWRLGRLGIEAKRREKSRIS